MLNDSVACKTRAILRLHILQITPDTPSVVSVAQANRMTDALKSIAQVEHEMQQQSGLKVRKDNG